MLKDQMPVAGNSSDTRRPILTVSPGERQKQLKNLKSPKNKELDSLKEEFYLYKQEYVFTKLDLEEAVTSAVKDLNKELLKLNKELEKKNKLITELNKKPTVE